MEVSAHKAGVIYDKELEDELMKFTVKSEDYGGVQKTPLVKQNEQVHKSNEAEVNITECTKFVANKTFMPQNQDLTESEGSTSFDDSESDFENVGILGDSEALSSVSGDAALPLDFDGFGDNFRRKKRTAHWRSFIQPIVWRCKWIELQIKKLQSLGQKYDRELEAHMKLKQIQLEDSSLMGGVKSVPFSRTNASNVAVRRKKRRMNEATIDIPEYMSHHNLFSYYENKKSCTEGAASMNSFSKVSEKATQKANIYEEAWTNDDLSNFVDGDGENSMEDILRKIELLQKQAGQLRNRASRFVQESVEKFRLIDELDSPVPFDSATARNGDGKAVGAYIASQLMSEYNMGDVHASVTNVTNHGEGVCEGDASADHAHFSDLYRNVEDGALIDNQMVKKDIDLKEIINPIQEPPPEATSVPVNTTTTTTTTTSRHLVNEPDRPTDNQPPVKAWPWSKTTGPRTKRRRGKNKAARRKTRRPTG